MKKLLAVISYIGLALTVIPSVLVLVGKIELKTNFWLMVVGMVAWFATAPFWMKGTSFEEKED